MYFLGACSAFDTASGRPSFPPHTFKGAGFNGEEAPLGRTFSGGGNDPALGQQDRLGNPTPQGFKIHPKGIYPEGKPRGAAQSKD